MSERKREERDFSSEEGGGRRGGVELGSPPRLGAECSRSGVSSIWSPHSVDFVATFPLKGRGIVFANQELYLGAHFVRPSSKLDLPRSAGHCTYVGRGILQWILASGSDVSAPYIITIFIGLFRYNVLRSGVFVELGVRGWSEESRVGQPEISYRLT